MSIVVDVLKDALANGASALIERVKTHNPVVLEGPFLVRTTITSATDAGIVSGYEVRIDPTEFRA